MFNFESKDHREVPEVDQPVTTTLQKEAHERVARHVSTQYHGTVIARVSGYRDWAVDEDAALSVAPRLWDRVVVIQANDTADLGTARLYHKSKGDDGSTSLYYSTEYSETGDDGCHVGDKAAAVMFAQHNIPCMGNFQHPFDFQWQRGEWEDE